MDIGNEFDNWATEGKDKEMEKRHWNTVKPILDEIPIEKGDIIVDLGTGSGYVPRFLCKETQVSRTYGLDASFKMLEKAVFYTNNPKVGYILGNFNELPFKNKSIDHVFSMEAFYYANNPLKTLKEIKRILVPGGSFYCAVNYFEENKYSHKWQENISIDMVLWSAEQYRKNFSKAGFSIAKQDNIPDRKINIPPEEGFPTGSWQTRKEMVERYREYGTLLTVGIKPD